jgi:hypothetical protein
MAGRLFDKKEPVANSAVKLTSGSHIISLGSAGTTLAGFSTVGISSFTICGWSYFDGDGDTIPSASGLVRLNGNAGRYISMDLVALSVDPLLRFGNSQTGLVTIDSAPTVNRWQFLAITATAIADADTLTGYVSPVNSESWLSATQANGIENSVNCEVIQILGSSASGIRHRNWRAFTKALTLDELRRLKRNHAPRGDEFFYWPLAYPGDLRDLSRNNKRPTFVSGIGIVDGAVVPLGTPNRRRLFVPNDVGGGGGGGVTGTFASTLQDTTAAFVGQIPHQGAFASTLANTTAAFSGEVINPGAFASTLGDTTGAFSGVVGHQGTFASTLSDTTASFTGTIVDRGTFASTLDNLTGAFAGTVSNRGTFASTLADTVASFSGAIGNAVTGAFASVLSNLTAAFVGTTPVTGTFASVLGNVTGSFAGQVETNGGMNVAMHRRRRNR